MSVVSAEGHDAAAIPLIEAINGLCEPFIVAFSPRCLVQEQIARALRQGNEVAQMHPDQHHIAGRIGYPRRP